MSELITKDIPQATNSQKEKNLKKSIKLLTLSIAQKEKELELANKKLLEELKRV